MPRKDVSGVTGSEFVLMLGEYPVAATENDHAVTDHPVTIPQPYLLFKD
jgi:hypothetical protein